MDSQLFCLRLFYPILEETQISIPTVLKCTAKPPRRSLSLDLMAAPYRACTRSRSLFVPSLRISAPQIKVFHCSFESVSNSSIAFRNLRR